MNTLFILLQAMLNPVNLLQGVGWLLTLYGQVLVTKRSKNAFIMWTIANLCNILVMCDAKLWGSACMFFTNNLFCVWSYRRWWLEEPRAKKGALYYVHPTRASMWLYDTRQRRSSDS